MPSDITYNMIVECNTDIEEALKSLQNLSRLQVCIDGHQTDVESISRQSSTEVRITLINGTTIDIQS